MKTFLFKIEPSSSIRGYNRTVSVYRIMRNQPVFIGYNDKISTASYRGDYAVAFQIIADNTRHKMAGSYALADKNIRLLEI